MAPDTRTIAAAALVLIVGKGKSLDAVLTRALQPIVDPRDRAFSQELVYGVLRWYWRLLPQLRSLLRRPLRARDRDVEMLLLIGLYQLRFLSTPAHAALSATVDACDGFNKHWAKGLINGTLRSAIRQAAELDELAMRSLPARTAHAEWFIQAVQRDWPDHWKAILEADNEYPPYTLRVNRHAGSRERYLALLGNAGIEARKTRFAAYGIHVGKPVPVELLPEFEQGSVSIQDEAAQLAATVLEIPDPARVLDCCAAPGGKTAHILESQSGELHVVALDRSDHRVERLAENLQRLGLHAEVQVADAGALDDWWDGLPFDRILLDSPCSSTGVIRRHPDIKIHRRPKDIENLVERQQHLLNSLWPVLKPGGKLIYGTCSVLRAENDGVVSSFVEHTRGAHVDRIAAQWGVATQCGRQILTGEDRMDGFYYARLTKE